MGKYEDLISKSRARELLSEFTKVVPQPVITTFIQLVEDYAFELAKEANRNTNYAGKKKMRVKDLLEASKDVHWKKSR